MVRPFKAFKVRPHKGCALRSIKEPQSEHEETKRSDEVAGFLGLLCCSLSPFGHLGSSSGFFWVVLGRPGSFYVLMGSLGPSGTIFATKRNETKPNETK
jgi:hypothetical protein